MADTPGCGLPSLVAKRDGSLVSFEADKISQSLYAATEKLGQPSAFLARELTDCVLHFLAGEIETDQPTTAQLGELVVKVVREMGQPALAQVYAEGQHRRHEETQAAGLLAKTARSEGVVRFALKDPPAAVVGQCLRAYSLQAVFARDVAAAHEEGLLALGGLDYPEELARQVVETHAAGNWLALLNLPARTIVFDSPEYALTEQTARPWFIGLLEFCEHSGRTAILNLHVTPSPSWANPGTQGPLFGHGAAPGPSGVSGVADLLREEARGKRGVLVDWHLGELDCAPQNSSALENWACRAAAGTELRFAFDRAKRPVALATGMDRQGVAALLDVGLDLPRFLGMTGVDRDARVFLDKLPSLARMAVRAGAQKRNFLRSRALDRPGLTRGFLLERARLVVTPMGLDEVVASLFGEGMAGSKLSLDLGQRVVAVLQETLQKESLVANLNCAIDGPGRVFPGLAGPVDARMVHAAGVLHRAAGFGALPVSGATAKDLAALLPYAWKKTDVVRLGGS